jgi:hypothetical protein
MARFGGIAIFKYERFIPGHEFLDLRVLWPVKHGGLPGNYRPGQDECG